jgi:hypothetical protein
VRTNPRRSLYTLLTHSRASTTACNENILPFSCADCGLLCSSHDCDRLYSSSSCSLFTIDVVIRILTSQGEVSIRITQGEVSIRITTSIVTISFFGDPMICKITLTVRGVGHPAALSSWILLPKRFGMQCFLCCVEPHHERVKSKAKSALLFTAEQIWPAIKSHLRTSARTDLPCVYHLTGRHKPNCSLLHFYTLRLRSRISRPAPMSAADRAQLRCCLRSYVDAAQARFLQPPARPGLASHPHSHHPHQSRKNSTQ